jgi:hypothetical protein
MIRLLCSTLPLQTRALPLLLSCAYNKNDDDLKYRNKMFKHGKREKEKHKHNKLNLPKENKYEPFQH